MLADACKVYENLLIFNQVARIQFQIQEALQRQCSHHSSVQDAISQLDSELMEISKVVFIKQKSRLHNVVQINSHFKLSFQFCLIILYPKTCILAPNIYIKYLLISISLLILCSVVSHLN